MAGGLKIDRTALSRKAEVTSGAFVYSALCVKVSPKNLSPESRQSAIENEILATHIKVKLPALNIKAH